MPDVNLTISEPISVAIRAAADVIVAILNYSGTHYANMTPAGKDSQDRINAQAYWDFRGVLKTFNWVGDELPWPPPSAPKG